MHVEAPDESGHMGDAELKTRAIEDFDKRLCSTLAKGLERFPEHLLLLRVLRHLLLQGGW